VSLWRSIRIILLLRRPNGCPATKIGSQYTTTSPACNGSSGMGLQCSCMCDALFFVIYVRRLNSHDVYQMCNLHHSGRVTVTQKTNTILGSWYDFYGRTFWLRQRGEML
jgi:hypothetical protein